MERKEKEIMENTITTVNTDDLMTIYIVYNKTTKYTKIGITEDYERRLEQLQNGCGNKLELVAKGKIKHAQEFERFLHLSFRNYRLHGEWFKLGENEISWLRNLWNLVFPTDSYLRNYGFPEDAFMYGFEIDRYDYGNDRYNLFNSELYEKKQKKQNTKLKLVI